MQRTNSLNSGHRACQGCGEALGARYAIDAAMRATDNQLIAVNATGCLEVFSTPYPGDLVADSVDPLAVRQRRRGRLGRRRGACACKGRSDVRVIAQGGDGGTTDIGFGCLSGHVRAQRRRALHLLRQRGLHEHRRAALERDAAGGAHRDDAGRRARSRATSSAPARTCR